MRANGDAIRAIRERSGLEQTAVAENAGISPSFLRDLETGRRTGRRNPRALRGIAQALKVPLTAIINESAEGSRGVPAETS